MSVQEQMGAGFLRQDRLDVEPIPGCQEIQRVMRHDDHEALFI